MLRKALFITLIILQSIKLIYGEEQVIKPNIIIFYADDLGWQDTELNDLEKPCPWKTPNIMALAKDGMNFINGYSPAPTCTPSRSALMSGLHPARTGITHVAGGKIPYLKRSSEGYIDPYFPMGLTSQHVTIAEVLQKNGYKTGHSGKWHIGELEDQKPLRQGFDFSYSSRGAHSGGGVNRLNNFATHNEDDPYRLSKEKYPPYSTSNPEGISYPKDEVTEQAIAFMDKNKSEPFFLYMAHFMVHSPIVTKNKALLTHHCEKMGIPFPTDPNFKVKEEGQNNPFYASMVTTLDWSLGRVVSFLKNTDDPRNKGKKLYETTYIFFSSDNGGAEHAGGGECVTDNYPLDKGKSHAQEGGIHVPMVIYGPNIKKGSECHTLVNQLDFFPTIMRLAKAKASDAVTHKLDGLNITNLFKSPTEKVYDSKQQAREYLWWHFPHSKPLQKQSAIRTEEFKLYKNLTSNDYALFQLFKKGEMLDIKEEHNLIEDKKYNAIAKDLIVKLEAELQKYNAQFPYKFSGDKSPFATNKYFKTIPKIVNEKYNATNREATIELQGDKTSIKEVFALAKISDPETQKGKVYATYIKIPAKADLKSQVYKVNIQEDAKEYVFMVIDKNQFMVKGELKKLN